MEGAPDQESGRHTAVKQYSLAQILAVWAAAALPMGVLAWIVAPWLRDQLSGDDPFVQALLICITAGLIWQFVLVLILLRRELAPCNGRASAKPSGCFHPDPKTGLVGGRVWWWRPLLPCCTPSGRECPGSRDPSRGISLISLTPTAGEDFFQDAWGWFAVVVVFAAFNTVLGEELLFRGLLLPRMQGVFGKRDWIANGALFALYHLHVPGEFPSPSSTASSCSPIPCGASTAAWMGIIVHSTQSVFVIALVLGLVLS